MRENNPKGGRLESQINIVLKPYGDLQGQKRPAEAEHQKQTKGLRGVAQVPSCGRRDSAVCPEHRRSVRRTEVRGIRCALGSAGLEHALPRNRKSPAGRQPCLLHPHQGGQELGARGNNSGQQLVSHRSAHPDEPSPQDWPQPHLGRSITPAQHRRSLRSFGRVFCLEIKSYNSYTNN